MKKVLTSNRKQSLSYTFYVKNLNCNTVFKLGTKKEYLSQREQWGSLKCNLGHQGLCHRKSFKADVYSPGILVKLLLRLLVPIEDEGLVKFPVLLAAQLSQIFLTL